MLIAGQIILTGQVAYLIKDLMNGNGIFSVYLRESDGRVEMELPFLYLTKHEVEFPHPKDVEIKRDKTLCETNYLTIGQLKKYLEENKDFLDDDGIVYYQRIEDIYFKEHNWDVRVKYDSLSADINPLWLTEDEFVPAFCCYGYKEGFQKDRNLYITAHY